MKRNTILMAGLLVLGLLSSCKKENDGAQDLNGTDLLRATIEQPTTSGSRTHIVVDGDTAPVHWTEGDQFVAVGANGEEFTFTLDRGESASSEPLFRSFGSEFMTAPFSVVYPATNSILGTEAIITLSATQPYAGGTFDEGVNPMVGYQEADEREVEFKNVLGGLCFPLTGDNLTVSRVVLTSANTADQLSGTFTVDCSSELLTLNCEDGNGNTITIDCGDGVTLSSIETDFYIMLPPGSLQGGFTVEAYDNNNALVMSKSTTNTPNIRRSVILRVDGDLEALTPLVVTTVSPTYITTNSVKCIGTVSDGTPLECGFLYAKASDLEEMGDTPASQLVLGNTDSRIHKVQATVASAFEVDLMGLASNTVYYVRAYVNYNVGELIPFATRRNYFADETNQGMMRRRMSDGDSNNDPFLFSTAADRKVAFSMGNLQYNAGVGTHAVNTDPVTTEAGTWRFAEYQFECVGNNPGNTAPSATQTEWIDLFGYGTSGWQSSAPCWRPYDTNYGNGNWDQSYLYSPTGDLYAGFLNSLTGPYANSDWGVYNAISNGGNTPNLWRTWQGYNWSEADHPEYGVHYDETYNLFTGAAISGRETYRFLLTTLTKRGDASMPMSVVNGHMACGTTMGGAIVFPDNFSWPTDYLDVHTAVNTFGTGAEITEAQWSLLEQQGAVFLPAGGYRRGGVFGAESYGYYNSATVTNWSAVNSMTIGFGSAESWLHWSNAYRFTGRSVRVVRTME